ncbi:MAG: phospholipase D-like domain-containing protein [Candidatus Contendobacter sp.]|nr:phospholipase D-like domain-containing protein [Candidatus Contendobacter sp.]MDS4058224.1 phospholipase D-like domain-containing protein [Candidatus Contendobacter sp.]
MSVQPIQDSTATIHLLTDDAWGPWFKAEIEKARSSVLLSIYMVSHHWRIPNRFGYDLLDILQQCGRRGLTCSAILAGSETIKSRTPFNQGAAQALTDANWRVRAMRTARLLHEKVLLIDRRLTIIGSHNISQASLTSNHDTSLAIESKPLAEQTWRLFWQRWRVAEPWKPQ